MSPLVMFAFAAWFCSCCWRLLPVAYAAPAAPFLWPADKDDLLQPAARLRAEIADELLLMAIGRHASFGNALMRPQPADDERYTKYAMQDDQQHVHAVVALQLLQKLRFMEAVDEALAAAANETLASVGADYTMAAQVFYETLRRKVEQNGVVLASFMDAEAQARLEYGGLPATRRRFSALRTIPVRVLLLQLARKVAFMKKVAICSLFLSAAREDAAQTQEMEELQQRQKKLSKLAKNVLELAKNVHVADHVERIFKLAVEETAEEVADVQDSQKTLSILCQKLLNKMRNDVLLNSEEIRAKIR